VRRSWGSPWCIFGLPYHSHYESEMTALAKGPPAELCFDMLPTGHHVHAGNRLRLAITGADADNFKTPVVTPALELSMHGEVDQASHVEVPLH
jgi:uncharacterized protein